MLLDTNAFLTRYRSIFTDFDFDEQLELDYNGKIYDLTDHEQLWELTDQSVRNGDYPISKISNNILAIYETKNKFIEYRHLPIIIHMELSGRCNCACMMCSHCYEKNDNAGYLSREKFLELERFFPTCRMIMINGYGEPLIYPNIREVLSVFEKYGVAILTTSNLQYLPEDALDLINRVFIRLNVSCDGARKETYESIRRGASFERFLENVKRLSEKCPDVQKFMSVVAMRQNIEEAVELVHFARRLGFEEIRFGRLGSNALLKNDKDELIYYPNYASKMLDEAKRAGEEIGIRVITPMILRNASYDPVAAETERAALHRLPFFMEQDYYDDLRRRFLELKAKGEFEHHLYSMEDAISCEGICHWVGYGFYINASGKIRPCVEIPHNRAQEKLPDEAVDYNYEELFRFRKSFVNGHVPKACMDCAFIMSNEVDCLKVNMEEYSKYFQDKVEEKNQQ